MQGLNLLLSFSVLHLLCNLTISSLAPPVLWVSLQLRGLEASGQSAGRSFKQCRLYCRHGLQCTVTKKNALKTQSWNAIKTLYLLFIGARRSWFSTFVSTWRSRHHVCDLLRDYFSTINCNYCCIGRGNNSKGIWKVMRTCTLSLGKQLGLYTVSRIYSWAQGWWPDEEQLLFSPLLVSFQSHSHWFSCYVVETMNSYFSLSCAANESHCL